MADPQRTIEFVMRYLAALEAGASGAELERFFDPDAVQEEFPNRLNPNGQQRDLAQLKESAGRGMELMAKQTYRMLDAVVDGDRAAIEVDWSGTLAVATGDLPAGHTIRARFAFFIELRHGRILRQRNYDCFLP